MTRLQIITDKLFKLLEEPRKVVAILLIWTTAIILLHFILGDDIRGVFPFCDGNGIGNLCYGRRYFDWPEYCFEYVRIGCFGASSIFAYGLLPWVAYGVYYLIKTSKNNQQH